MKKILILIVMALGLVACGEKFPYTSQSTKEKMGEIIKISTELEKRSSEGDEKAKEELEKWDKMITEIKPQ